MNTQPKPARVGRAWMVGVATLISLTLMTYSIPVAHADTTTTTVATTPTTFPPAPGGFAQQLVNVYQAEFDVGTRVSKSDTLTSMSDYQAAVDKLTPTELGGMYYATQQVPQWAQIPTLLETVESDLPAAPAPQSTPGGAAPALALSAATPLAGTATNPPATPFQADPCDQFDIPDGAVFAMQIVIDAALAVYNIAAAWSWLDGAVAVVAAFVLFAATIVHDTLAYLQTLASTCEGKNIDGYLAHIDTTTVQAYNLLPDLTNSLVKLQSTLDDTQLNVDDLQALLTSFEKTIDQKLSSDLETLQGTNGNDVQTLQSLLQTVQLGLKQNIKTVQAASAADAKNTLDDANKNHGTLQSLLSTTVQHALQETDTNAQTLNDLITQNDQQLTNLLQGNFDTGQTEYQSKLKQAIEIALGTGVPQVQFKLPASMGGYLDATPVGVQKVVNDDIQAFQSLKVPIQPSVMSLMNAGNAALAAGQYLLAYADFQKAYQGFEVGA